MTDIRKLNDDQATFLRRCETQLRIAKEVGAPTWQVEALEELLVDAREEFSHDLEEDRGPNDRDEVRRTT